MKHSPLTMKDFIERIRIFESQTTSTLNEANCYRNKKGHFSSAKDAKTYSCTNAALRSGAIKDKDKIKRGKVTAKGKISSPFGMNTSKEKSCGRKLMSGEDISNPKYSCSKYNARYENLDVEESEETALIATKTDALSARRAISDLDTTTGKRNVSKPRKSSKKRIIVKVSRKPVIETLVQQDSKAKQQVILSDLVDGILELIESTNDDELMAHIFQELERLPKRKMSADELKSICSKSGYVSPDRYLDFINKSALASDGKLNQPQHTK